MHESAAEFVAEASDRYGFDPDVMEFPEGTKTAADAADAIGCDVAQIGSSIVLVADGEIVVSVTSGANRVDTDKLAGLVGAESARMANADEVKEATGWSIGGVPPFCHATDLPVYLDETLTTFETVWVASGTPTTVFPIAPDELLEYSGATVADVAE
ncbi:YbaK/EbsC family protein [Haloarchaeobius sp. HME9146]|uniref:YbaK/EbsC family protein n=1 Tax=Haloarchaeobius sp. HME9146 TaxID=2978732 RepID=UPI0021C19F3B|nr:YbaK/EbsC family protein [Haloarchaeobius sp. HME9146]MCT9096812.1 YbaK/EbsC family protein [Haloarchaeobius sp. HME9146]